MFYNNVKYEIILCYKNVSLIINIFKVINKKIMWVIFKAFCMKKETSIYLNHKWYNSENIFSKLLLSWRNRNKQFVKFKDFMGKVCEQNFLG